MAQSVVHASDSEEDIVSVESDRETLPPAPAFCKSMRRGAACGLSGKEYRLLRRFQAPRLLYVLLQCLALQFDGRIQQDLWVCEFFSGAGELVQAAHRRSWQPPMSLRDWHGL